MVKTNSGGSPFVWDQDPLWDRLEQQFAQARSQSSPKLKSQIGAQKTELRKLIRHVEESNLDPGDPLWGTVEAQMWELAPLVAAQPREFEDYLHSVVALQRVLKHQAENWPPDQETTRNRLYRMVYGGRTATEEIALQGPSDTVSGLVMGEAISSRTPSITIQGVTIHSGDVLVSRGGAPTSALIARGSDYPGNFSHAALAYVDVQSGEGVVIEALIEKGVVITSVDEYLKDKKLRILVLRPRPDLPLLQKNPLAPHEAATYIFQRARSQHIPYDFAMEFRAHDKMFCSEVVYAAYAKVGIQLWTGLSRISAPGTARWLAGFGVSHFITLEPSDLEYDPQLAMVAEWRDPDTLFKDHLDNAVTDAMLEGANAGDELKYDWYLLPLVRLVKAYSMIKNLWGGRGPLPEGMTATAVLRNRWYSARHAMLSRRVEAEADEFRTRNGYRAPYWELVKMAREANGSR